MKRLEDWPVRLSEYLTQAAKIPFRWGEHDCLIHAANAVRAMTEADPAAEYRGQYSTEDEAYALVDEMFGGDTDNVVRQVLDDPCDNIKLARRGDIARMTNSDGRKAYGVVDDSGRRACFITEKKGLVRYALSHCDCFWKVP